MSATTTILVPVDFSAFSEAAIEQALSLAKPLKHRVRLIHALALPLVALEYNSSGPIWSELRASETEKLEALRRRTEDRGLTVSISFEEGDPARIIQAAGRAPDVELIVMGSHGLRGADRTLIGSVVDRTLHGAPVPVVVVRGEKSKSAAPVRTVLFATDFSESARCVEPIVVLWAKRLGAEVEVLHVVPDTTVLFVPYAVPESRMFDSEVLESAERRLGAVVERLQQEGITTKSKVVVGYASREIVKHAEASGVDLIAMGSRGHAGLRRYRLGSVVQRVLEDAPCSLLVGTEPPPIQGE